MLLSLHAVLEELLSTEMRESIIASITSIIYSKLYNFTQQFFSCLVIFASRVLILPYTAQETQPIKASRERDTKNWAGDQTDRGKNKIHVRISHPVLDC